MLTTNVVNQLRRTVVVVPLSSSPNVSPPLLVPVVCAGRPAVAVVDQIRAVAKERLHRRLGSLSAEDVRAVEVNLREILELIGHLIVATLHEQVFATSLCRPDWGAHGKWGAVTRSSH